MHLPVIMNIAPKTCHVHLNALSLANAPRMRKLVAMQNGEVLTCDVIEGFPEKMKERGSSPCEMAGYKSTRYQTYTPCVSRLL